MSSTLLDSPLRRRGPRRVARLCAVLLVALLGACGNDDATNGADGASAGTGEGSVELPEVADSEYEDMTGQDTVTIDTRDNTFGPQYVVVSPGTEVVFENRGRNPHNVVAVEEGAFEDVPQDQLQPGDSAAIVFDQSGDYPYYCSLHATPARGMTGRIRVADS